MVKSWVVGKAWHQQVLIFSTKVTRVVWGDALPDSPDPMSRSWHCPCWCEQQTWGQERLVLLKCKHPFNVARALLGAGQSLWGAAVLRTHEMLDFLLCGDFFPNAMQKEKERNKDWNPVSEKMGDSISFFPAVALDLIMISIICKLLFQLLSSPVPFFFFCFSWPVLSFSVNQWNMEF